LQRASPEQAENLRGRLWFLNITHITDFSRHDDLVQVADNIFNKSYVRRLENGAVWNFQDRDRFAVLVHDYFVSIDVRPIGGIT
jgi:hypothetical protein